MRWKINYNLKRLGWTVGRQLQSYRSDYAAKKALDSAAKRGADYLIKYKKMVGSFKQNIEKSPASDKMKKWVHTKITETVTNYEAKLKGINIFKEIAHAKIDSIKASQNMRRTIQKTLYKVKTQDGLTAAIKKFKDFGVAEKNRCDLKISLAI